MKRRSTLFDVLTTLSTRAIGMAAGFAISVLTARLLGPEGKGLLAAITVIPGIILSLADLGIRQSTAHFVGKKSYPLETIASSLIMIWMFTTLISVGLASISYRVQFGTEHWWLIAIVLITIPFNLATNYLSGLLQGKQRILNLNLLELGRPMLNIVLIVGLVYVLRLDVAGMLIASLLVSVYNVGLAFYIASKDVRFRLQKQTLDIPTKIMSKGIMYAVALFVLQLNYRVDLVMIDWMATTYDVGIYSLATGVAELIWQIPAAIGMVLFARSSNSRTDSDAVQRTSRMIRVLLPIMLLLGGLMWIIMPEFVRIVYGTPYLPSIPVIRLLLPGVIVMFIVKLIHTDVAARGNPLFGMWLAIGPLLINIAMNLVMIPLYGVNGAAITTTVSYTIASVLFLLAYARKERVSLRKILLIERADVAEMMSRLRLNPQLRSSEKRKGAY